MRRDYRYKNSPFVFNSDDTVDHPWGDFILRPIGSNVELILDGNTVFIGKEIIGHWIFFHRDENGKIDHIFTTSNAGSHLEDCPLCGGEIAG